MNNHIQSKKKNHIQSKKKTVGLKKKCLFKYYAEVLYKMWS